MKIRTYLGVGTITLLAASSAVWAQTNRTFRTPAAIVGVLQGADVAGKPQYDFENFAGHDLVNLALGTPLTTARTNEVLALEVACDSSSAKLVVFDRTASSNITTIATSSRIDVVQDQGKKDTATFPSHERFVALMNMATLGTSSNGLVGGYVALAGRIHLDPVTGCPRAVRVDTDRKQDRLCGDPKAIKDMEITEHSKLIAGRAHFAGVLDIVSLGTTNTVLVPSSALNINRQLAP